jgi:hypothetical protein
MRSRTGILLGLALALGLAPGPRPAGTRADNYLELTSGDPSESPNLQDSGPRHDSGSYLYSYDVSLATRTALAPTGGGNTGHYFTISDVFGDPPGRADSGSAAAWSAIEGQGTPAFVPLAQEPSDDPGAPRVVFKSNGPATLGAGINPLYLGQVTLRAMNPLAGTAISPSAGTTQLASHHSLIASNTTHYLGPSRGSIVPEPTALTLCGLGLLGLAGYRLRPRWRRARGA